MEGEGSVLPPDGAAPAGSAVAVEDGAGEGAGLAAGAGAGAGLTLTGPSRLIVISAIGACVVLGTATLFASIPVTNHKGTHDCASQTAAGGGKVYGSESVVARIGEAKRWAGVPTYLIAPVLYAITTAVLGASLMREVRDGKGILDASKALFSPASPLAPTFLGALCGIALMGSLSASFSASETEMRECDTEAHVLSTSEQLFKANIKVFAAVALSFLRDGFLLSSGAHAKPKDAALAFVPIVILIATLTIFLRQRGATFDAVVKYALLLSTLLLLEVLIANLVLRAFVTSLPALLAGQRFLQGLVPTAIVWVLFCDLIPHCSRFYDDEGDQIPNDTTIQADAEYEVDATSQETKTVPPSVAALFNNRSLISDGVLIVVLLFLVTLTAAGRKEDRGT